MNKEQILEEQIKALERLLELKSQVVVELEKKLAIKEVDIVIEKLKPQPRNPFEPYRLNPSDSLNVCLHEYDYNQNTMAWPMKCKKCGQWNNHLTYTTTSTSGAV